MSEGYKLQFLNNPVLPPSVSSSTTNCKYHLALATQIQKLLVSKAISKVPFSPDHLLSRVFTVKKANGDDRMILDLSKLNIQIAKVSFQMETHSKITELLNKNDFMGSIDLADAFFSVPVHDSCKKFLAFEFDGYHYVYNVLPFGLTSSPRIFSKILKPAIIHLRSQGVKISFYLDDIFLCSPSSEELQSHITQTLNLLISLGFTPNYKKSNLNPSKNLLHLGYLWDSVSMSLTVPPDKVLLTNRQASRILSRSSTLRDISSFLGRIISHKTAFHLAPLHYRNLQLQFCSLLKSNVPWDAVVSLNSSSLSDVSWWSSCPMSLPPHSLLLFQSDITLHSDASNSGWGGVLSSGSATSGLWSTSEKKYHINYLELKAVILCISSFLSELKHSSLHIFSDNMTTVFYINKVGGTQSSELCLLALDLWRLLDANKLSALPLMFQVY